VSSINFVVYWYGRIFQTLRKVKHRQIQQEKHVVSDRLATKNRNDRHHHDILTKRRSVLTSLLQAFGFLPPYALFTATFIFIIVLGSEVRTPLFFVTLSVSDALLLLNSLMNPIVFCLRTTEFRNECKKILGVLTCQNEVAPLPFADNIEMLELNIPNQDQIQRS